MNNSVAKFAIYRHIAVTRIKPMVARSKPLVVGFPAVRPFV